MFDPSFPNGWWYYFRSCEVDTLSDEVIEVTAEHAQRIPLAVDRIPDLPPRGRGSGADGRRRTPSFHGRTSGHIFNINATTSRPATAFDAEREWSRTFWTALQPYQRGVTVNFLREATSGSAKPTGRRRGGLRALKQQ